MRVLHEEQAVATLATLPLFDELLLDAKRFAPIEASEIQHFTFPHTVLVSRGALDIDGQAVDGVEGFSHGLVKSRMRVDGVHQSVDGCLSLHGQDRL